MNLARRFLFTRPLVSATILAVMTLAAGGGAIIMADFGKPIWLFAPLLLWLGTIGLPATLGVLLVASCWGRSPLLTGFVPFAVCAALVAIVAEATALILLAKLRGRFV